MKVGLLFTTNSRNNYYLCNLCIYTTNEFVETIIYCVDMFMCAIDWRRAGGQPLLRTDVSGVFFKEGFSHILKIEDNDEKRTISYESQNYYNM